MIPFKTRIVWTVIVILLALSMSVVVEQMAAPVVSTDVAVNQVEDSDESFVAMRGVEEGKKLLIYMEWAVWIAVIVGIWFYPVKRILTKLAKGNTMKRGLMLMSLLGIVSGMSGCWKPYPTPKYAEVGNNETAFVIPLEGETGKQMKFASVEFLEKAQVATKRIQIPLRWNKKGRLPRDGEWIPMVKVLTVDRTPVTREWTADKTTGTQRKDDAIWVESADSVGFSVGFLVTAYIRPEDASRFLFLYPSGSLSRVLDTEVRSRVQAVAAEQCSNYKMDVLREKKNDVSTAVKNDVTSFYENRGITITSIAMFGGFHYENPAIQEAIDKTFVAQQEKVIAAALFEAQNDLNRKIELAAEAEAAKIRKVNDALLEASQNPLYLQIKLAEIDLARVEKWNGQYPQWYMGGGMSGDSPNIMIQPPSK